MHTMRKCELRALPTVNRKRKCESQPQVSSAPSFETSPTQYSMMRIYFTAPPANFRAFYLLNHKSRERMGMRNKREGETWASLVRSHALLPTADARWVGFQDIRAGDVDGEERRN